LALALAATGLKDEAWSVAHKGKQLNDGLPLGEGYFGYLMGTLGCADEAREVIAEVQVRRKKEYSPALPIAWT
jgi:hypothetical protein